MNGARPQYHETELYRQVAQYLNLKHPDVVYHFDLSGVHNPSRTTRGIYKSLNGSGFPDLVIYSPAYLGGTVNIACGLALELKREGTRLQTRTGRWASEHIAEQNDVLERLREAGYVAQFAVGYESAIEIIESYLQGMSHAD